MGNRIYGIPARGDSEISTSPSPYVMRAIELGVERIKELERQLKIAVRFLNEGKKKFTPNTTNSDVDEFLEKHKELLSE